jgi:thiol-disulfide isomerase/thioredoxin
MDWCGPCVAEGIPKLIDFVNNHNASQDRFRVIAIHARRPGDVADWQRFHTSVTKFEHSVWKGTSPFPLVYDESGQMTSDWGIHSFPTGLLIDPQGNLVQHGDLKMLPEKIDVKATK